jgi:TIR domain
VPKKIFISYRRDDSAANALGIGQYLEHEFGSKNVFIDVDMRAGTNFPSVLEQRLAECKVMLVLIGPNWLNAKDGLGRRRLDAPDDWVRLEIASALKHQITIIPVRINGTDLPLRSALPEDIQGLLNYQAVSVTHTGFRTEMAGLVRDIRAISDPSSRRKYVALTVGALALLLAVLFLRYSPLEHLYHAPQQASSATDNNKQNALWIAKPGDWVLYAFDLKPVAFYFNPSSVKYFGDRVAFDMRFPLKPDEAKTSPDNSLLANSYEQDTQVLDCKKSLQVLAERTVFNKSGDIAFNFKWGDPGSIDLSIGGPIAPNSILSLSERIMCDEDAKMSIISKDAIKGMPLTLLSSTANGDGQIYYGPKKNISNGPYTIAMPAIIKLHKDHEIAEIAPKQSILGFQARYRTLVQPLQFDCANKKILSVLIEDLDAENNSLFLGGKSQEFDVKANPFASLFAIACEGQVSGTYVGMNEVTTAKGGEGAQKISIVVVQSHNNLNVTFETASGGQGNGTGTLTGNKVSSLSLKSSAPECPGSYDASLEFSGETVKWTYQGMDCGGSVTGHGTATREMQGSSQR